jgi:hypothetical protein
LAPKSGAVDDNKLRPLTVKIDRFGDLPPEEQAEYDEA